MYHRYYLLAAILTAATAVPVAQPELDPLAFGVVSGTFCGLGYWALPGATAFWPLAAVAVSCLVGGYVGTTWGNANPDVIKAPKARVNQRSISKPRIPEADPNAGSQGLGQGSGEFQRRLDESIALINRETKPGGALDPAKGFPVFWTQAISEVLKVAQPNMLDLTNDDFGLQEALPSQFFSWTNEALANVA